MPVFLSHKREDTPKTLEIANYLKSNGISCYVDALDSDLKSTDDITKLLTERIRQCTHLMAVVSLSTVQSWWVPFEIGVGSILDRRISTFSSSKTYLPDYLSKWPILTQQAELSWFVALYRMDTTVQFSEGRTLDASVSNADQFHAALKSLLKQ